MKKSHIWLIIVLINSAKTMNYQHIWLVIVILNPAKTMKNQITDLCKTNSAVFFDFRLVTREIMYDTII